MKDVLEGNESTFILRRNRDENNEVKQWPDSSADDYRFRDDDPEKDLDNMSFYEFTMMYGQKNNTFKEMNSRSEDGNDN